MTDGRGRHLRPRRAATAVIIGLLCGTSLAACVGNSAGAPDVGIGEGGQKLRVVTTVSPITSIVASIAGDLAIVGGIVPEGVNSHTFEPPPSVARTLARADVVFINGLKLEESTRRLAEKNLGKGATLVALGDEVLAPSDYIYDFSFPKVGGKPNPHLWTSPPLAREYGRVVAEVLSARDPTHAAQYDSNRARFAAAVDELDRAMVDATASVPPENRKLLTYHDGYAYFARHYGWRIIGAMQPSSFEEPTPRDVARLIVQLRSEQTPAIFGSEVFPSDILEQIGREARARYIDVLRDDDLPGEPGSPEHSWLGLMRFNFVTMVDALGGDSSALRAVHVDGGVSTRDGQAR